MTDNAWEQTEEDTIIAMLQETRATNYCDPKFTADNTSLYRDTNYVPDYDAHASGPIRWMRAMDYATDPEYLLEPGPSSAAGNTSSGVLVSGRQDDLWLVTAMGAVASHPVEDSSSSSIVSDRSGGGSMIETIFSSAPDDFKHFGVYTVRIYKNGVWTEVVTDTRVPCAPLPKELGKYLQVPGLNPKASMAPITCRNESANETWAVLLGKAFAKHHGCFEALNGGDTGEALVDLTGGSCETLALRSKACRLLAEGGQGGKLWVMLDTYLEDRHVLMVASVPTEAEDARERDLAAAAAEAAAGGVRRTISNAVLPKQGSSASLLPRNDSSVSLQPSLAGGSAAAASGFDPGSGFSVLGFRRVGEFGQFELVHLRSYFAGGGDRWKGDWGRSSAKWTEVPEVGIALSREGGVPLTEYASGDDTLHFGSDHDDGTFWMSFADFLATFSKVYVCKVFPDSRYKQFCVHGEWVPQPEPSPEEHPSSSSSSSSSSLGAKSYAGSGSGNNPALESGAGLVATSGGSLRLHPNDPEVAAACEVNPNLSSFPANHHHHRSGGGGGACSSGSTASSSTGAAPRPLEGLNYTEALLTRGSPDHVVKVPSLVTPSCSWFTNPQFTLSLGVGSGDSGPVPVHVSLMQEDRRTKSGLNDNAPIGFTVVRSRPPVAEPDQPPLQGAPAARVWSIDRSSDVVFDSTKGPLVNAGTGWAPAGVPLPGSTTPGVAAFTSAHARHAKPGAASAAGGGAGGEVGPLGCGLDTPAADATREVTCPHLVLSPGYVYTVVPHTERQGLRSRFVLRVFCPLKADVAMAAVPPPHAVGVEGAWARASSASAQAGGGGGQAAPVDTAGGALLSVQAPPKKPSAAPAASASGPGGGKAAGGGAGGALGRLAGGGSGAAGKLGGGSTGEVATPMSSSLSPGGGGGRQQPAPALVLGANPKWCENPQYVLRLPRGLGPAARVEATVVVRRTDLERSVTKVPAPGYAPAKPGGARPSAMGSGNNNNNSSSNSLLSNSLLGQQQQQQQYRPPPEVDRVTYDSHEPAVGVVVAKVSASEDPAERRRRVKQENSTRTNALGEKLATKETSLKVKPRSVLLLEEKEARALAAGENFGGGASFSGELPPERKTVVSSKEWHVTSDYSNRAVAMVKLPTLSPSFCPDGLVVVPTLSETGARGKFSVQVLSDCPGLKLEPMPEGRATVLSGAWSEGSSGGSHMHRATWKKNPHFHLRLLSPAGCTKVKITLSRPAAAWKQQAAKDSLGCMLGFYVCKGPVAQRPGEGSMFGAEEIYHEGEPWSETAFVPANSVSTPNEFELPPLDGEVYTITPCTFEPGKVGPFVLSVTADAEVVLNRDSGGGSNDAAMGSFDRK